MNINQQLFRYDSTEKQLVNTTTGETMPYKHIHVSDRLVFSSLQNNVPILEIVRDGPFGSMRASPKAYREWLNNARGRAKLLVKYPDKLNPNVGTMTSEMIDKYNKFIESTEDVEKVLNGILTEKKAVNKYMKFRKKAFLLEMGLSESEYNVYLLRNHQQAELLGAKYGKNKRREFLEEVQLKENEATERALKKLKADGIVEPVTKHHCSVGDRNGIIHREREICIYNCQG